METIWVYKPPQYDYIIARRTPFGFYSPVSMDIRSGHLAHTMIQGIGIAKPVWDWKQKIEGVWYAGFNGLIYEISDLELVPLRSGPPKSA
jgi:hypothetical protein